MTADRADKGFSKEMVSLADRAAYLKPGLYYKEPIYMLMVSLLHSHFIVWSQFT